MGAHKKTKTMNKHSIHIQRYTKNQAKGSRTSGVRHKK